MENSSTSSTTTVEVDDAVATIIANVNFGEFAPEVVQGNFVVTQIHQQEDGNGGTSLDVEIQQEDHHHIAFIDEEEGKSLQQDFAPEADEEKKTAGKKPRKPRRRRTEEDGEYPDIKEWKPFINSLIDQGVRGLHKTPVPIYENASPSIQEYLKPDIIIWDLQKECPEIANGTCPETNCSEPLSLYPIAYTYMMRVLYDFEKPVLLVTSMLRCKNGREHRFLGYDPRILKQLPEPDKVPFVLFHKVGITRELFNSIMSQVSNGVKFGHIQDALRKNYMKAHLDRKQAYDLAVQQYLTDNPDKTQESKSFPSIKIKGPRNTFIGQCFLLGFKEKEYFYKLSMSQILADEWIKLDSEFKLPTNVGTNSKGVWRKEVDHLFCCQNEFGQVLTWQLTGQGSFEEVRDMLVSIRDRHDQIGKQLKGCCTDSCCNWRDQLKSIFGAEFQVKYDIEIAVCKLAEKLQEDSPLFKPCLDNFRLAFQDPVDCNKIRILHTPPPNVIVGNLDLFKEKWKKIKDDNGKHILSTSALRVISEMEPHIMNGCYSEIPPYPNGIERKDFQDMLRKKVNNCRLGIPVMVAIATIALHDHNTARQEELGRDTAPVLLVVPDEEKNAADAQSNLSLGNTNLQCLTVEVNMNKALESIASSQAKAVKTAEVIDTRNLITMVDEYFTKMKKDTGDHNYDSKDQIVDEIVIKKALMYLRFNEKVVQLIPSLSINEKLVPFLTCAFPLLMQEKPFEEDDAVISGKISDIMKNFTEYGVVLGKVPSSVENTSRDDNFFHALAVIVESYLKGADASSEKDMDADLQAFRNALKELNLQAEMSCEEISNTLKDRVKKNITGNFKTTDAGESNKEKSEEEMEPEHDFNDDGEFEVLVRETSSLLSSQISIISTLKYFPVVPIFPQDMLIWSPNLFLFCYGSRFLPVVSKKLSTENPSSSQTAEEEGSKEAGDQTVAETSSTPRVKCRCGRGNNSKEIGKCYTHLKSRYITRCLCFRMQQPCTSRCDCRNCRNTFGCRPEKKKPIPVQHVTNPGTMSGPPYKRRRHTHHHASLSKDLVAENFQTGAGLEVSLGKWSITEKFLFEALISELKTEEESLTTELVAQKFNNVVQVASSIPGLQNLVGFKTPTQVNERLKEREKDVEVYLEMYQKQLDALINKNAIQEMKDNGTTTLQDNI
eukprot:gene9941-10961_t